MKGIIARLLGFARNKKENEHGLRPSSFGTWMSATTEHRLATYRDRALANMVEADGPGDAIKAAAGERREAELSFATDCIVNGVSAEGEVIFESVQSLMADFDRALTKELQEMQFSNSHASN